MTDWLIGDALATDFSALDLVVAILVSFGLSVLIGLTYQRTHRGALYAQGFVHTLVLMSMLTAVTIMVVGGSVARAFAVFGAFSMIRFRNALPETRDVGFIFFAMVVGMAAGAGRPDMAVVATLVVCVVVLATSRLDLFATSHASQLLRVRVSNDMDHAKLFEETLARHAEQHRLLSLESVQAGMLTEATYSVVLKRGASAAALVAELRERNGNNRVLLLANVPEAMLVER